MFVDLLAVVEEEVEGMSWVFLYILVASKLLQQISYSRISLSKLPHIWALVLELFGAPAPVFVFLAPVVEETQLDFVGLEV